jgi:hypothetical protein
LSGDTSVVIFAQGFIDLDTIKCRFDHGSAELNDGTVPGNLFINDNGRAEVHCVSPQSSKVGRGSLSVSLDGRIYSESDFSFNYYASPVVKAIEPSLGPVSGKTRVQLLDASSLTIRDQWDEMWVVPESAVVVSLVLEMEMVNTILRRKDDC